MKNAHFHDGIIVPLALTILALVLGLTCAYRLRRHYKSKGIHNNKTHKFCHNPNFATNGNEQNLECTYYSTETPANLGSKKESSPMLMHRLEIRPNQLEIEGVLGSGAYGIIKLRHY